MDWIALGSHTRQLFHDLLHDPVMRPILVGVWAAARVDREAFHAFKSFNDAAEYNWKIAGWRWFQAGVEAMFFAFGMDRV